MTRGAVLASRDAGRGGPGPGQALGQGPGATAMRCPGPLCWALLLALGLCRAHRARPRHVLLILGEWPRSPAALTAAARLPLRPRHPWCLRREGGGAGSLTVGVCRDCPAFSPPLLRRLTLHPYPVQSPDLVVHRAQQGGQSGAMPTSAEAYVPWGSRLPAASLRPRALRVSSLPPTPSSSAPSRPESPSPPALRRLPVWVASPAVTGQPFLPLF